MQDLESLYTGYGIPLPTSAGKIKWPNGLVTPYYLGRHPITMNQTQQDGVVAALAGKYASVVVRSHLNALINGSPITDIKVDGNGKAYVGALQSSPRGAEFCSAVKAACYGRVGSEKGAALLRVLSDFGFEPMPNLGAHDLRGMSTWIIPNCIVIKAKDFNIVPDDATLHAFGNARHFYFRASSELCDGIIGVASDINGIRVGYVTNTGYIEKNVIGTPGVQIADANNESATYRPICNGQPFSAQGTDEASILFRNETGQSIVDRYNCTVAGIIEAVASTTGRIGTTMMLGGYNATSRYYLTARYFVLGHDPANHLLIGELDTAGVPWEMARVSRVYTYLPSIAARYQAAAATSGAQVDEDAYTGLNMNRYLVSFNDMVDYSVLLSSTSVNELAELLDEDPGKLDLGGVTAGAVAQKVQDYRKVYGVKFGPIIVVTADVNATFPDLSVSVAGYSTEGVTGTLGTDIVDVADIGYTLLSKSYDKLTVAYSDGLSLAGLMAATAGTDFATSIYRLAAQYDSRDVLAISSASAARSSNQLMLNLNPLYSYTTRGSSDPTRGSDIAFGCCLSSGRELLEIGRAILAGPGGSFV